MKNYQHFIDTLITLKSYYQQLVEEYSRKANEALEQLNHVDALLFDQLQRQYKQQSANSSQAETLRQTGAAAPKTPLQNISPPDLPEVDLNSNLTKPLGATEQKLSESEAINSTVADVPESAPPKTSPFLSPKVEVDLGISDPAMIRAKSDLKEATLPLTTGSAQDEQPSAANAKNESNQPPSVLESVISLPIEQAIEADANESNRPQGVELVTTNEINSIQPIQDKETASSVATPTGGGRDRHTAPLKTPLLPLYQHLTKSEAVENFLQSNEGKTFHIDDITRGLHGDLGTEAIRAERARMYDTLKKGAARGFWETLPDEINYYTINLKSVGTQEKLESEPEQKSQKRETTTKSLEGILPQYQHLNFTEAVAIVVQSKAGETLTPEQLARELYGDLEGKALTIAKERAGKTLWRGARLGWWQRVPGQLGQYTLDLNQL